jgi:hypothetical protein
MCGNHEIDYIYGYTFGLRIGPQSRKTLSRRAFPRQDLNRHQERSDQNANFALRNPLLDQTVTKLGFNDRRDS